MLEKRLLSWVENELKRRIPFLTHWKIKRYEKNRRDSIVDMLLTARYRDKIYHFCVKVKRAGYPQYVREGIFHLEEYRRGNPSYYSIIAVPRLGEQGKKICNKHKVGYMDFDGNMKIAFGSIHIEIEGKRGQPYAAQRQSLFSPKAVRVTKCLLYEPHRVWMQKDIVRRTQLSKGMVSRIVKQMVEAGYLLEEANKLKLTNFDDLLSAWTEKTVLQRRENSKCYYVWAQNPQRLMRAIADEFSRRKIRYAFTQEAGASLIAPFATFDIVSLYIEAFDKFALDSLSASETKKGFNVVIFEAPDETLFEQARERKGMKVADNLQLYVDLKKNPLRGGKQAEHILNVIKGIPGDTRYRPGNQTCSKR